MIAGLDPENAADAERIIEIITAEEEKTEFWRLHEYTLAENSANVIRLATRGAIRLVTGKLGTFPIGYFVP